MKKFIFEIVLYIFIFTIFSAAMSVIIYSFDRDDFITNYEGPEMVKKYNYIKDNPFVYDTLFFGSSITLRGIIPEQFDELNGNKTNSFNMGLPGVRFSRQVNITELALKDFTGVKTIFFELDAPFLYGKKMGKGIYKSNRMLYSFSFKNFFMNMDYILKRNWDTQYESIELGRNFGRLLYKYSGIGISKHLYLLTGAEESPKKNNLGKERILSRGYSPGELYENSVEDEKLEKLKEKTRTYFDGSFGEGEYERDKVVDEAERLADVMTEKGIDFYFVLFPLAHEPRDVLSMKYYLEKDGYRFIDIGNIEKYPEVYEVQNMLDMRHLNEDGAILNTKNLFEEYEKISY